VGDFKGDTLSLQRILGHTSPVTTQKYVRLAGQDIRRMHERLSPADQLVGLPDTVERRRKIR